MTVNLVDIANYPKSKLNRIALIIANLSDSNWTLTPAAARQTINGKTSMTLSSGKVAMMVPTPNGWLDIAPVETFLQSGVSVADFGAVGDGVASDTTSLQIILINYLRKMVERELFR